LLRFDDSKRLKLCDDCYKTGIEDQLVKLANAISELDARVKQSPTMDEIVESVKRWTTP